MTYVSTPSPHPRTPPPQTGEEVMMLEQIEGEVTYSVSSAAVSPVSMRGVGLGAMDPIKEGLRETRRAAEELGRSHSRQAHPRPVHDLEPEEDNMVDAAESHERTYAQDDSPRWSTVRPVGGSGGADRAPAGATAGGILPRSPASPTFLSAHVSGNGAVTVGAGPPGSGGAAAAAGSANDKPYKCPLCPKSFTRNYDLTRHKSSHQDARQHVCAHCGRSFNRRDALTRDRKSVV